MHRPGTAHKAMEAAMERTDTGKALPRRATGRRAMRTGAQPRTMGSPLPAPSSMLPGQGPRMQGTGRGQPGTARATTQGMGRLRPARSAALMHMEAAKARCRSFSHISGLCTIPKVPECVVVTLLTGTFDVANCMAGGYMLLPHMLFTIRESQASKVTIGRCASARI